MVKRGFTLCAALLNGPHRLHLGRDTNEVKVALSHFAVGSTLTIPIDEIVGKEGTAIEPLHNAW